MVICKKKLLYTDVPSYYTCNAKNKVFERRKQGKSVDDQPTIFKDTTIGRLFTIHPNQSECFFLRLLLVNVLGPTSFDYLGTVNGSIHDTYRNACQALNLFQNDHNTGITASMTRAKRQLQVKFVHCLESY